MLHRRWALTGLVVLAGAGAVALAAGAWKKAEVRVWVIAGRTDMLELAGPWDPPVNPGERVRLMGAVDRQTLLRKVHALGQCHFTATPWMSTQQVQDKATTMLQNLANCMAEHGVVASATCARDESNFWKTTLHLERQVKGAMPQVLDRMLDFPEGGGLAWVVDAPEVTGVDQGAAMAGDSTKPAILVMIAIRASGTGIE